jgi:hypothetical protein
MRLAATATGADGLCTRHDGEAEMPYLLCQRVVIINAVSGRCDRCGRPGAITVSYVVERAPDFIPDQVCELTDCEYCDQDLQCPDDAPAPERGSRRRH